MDDMIDGKKTDQLGVKMPDAMKRAFKLVAEEAGMTPQELLRALIAQHLQTQRDKYHALHSIFGSQGEISKVSGDIRGAEE